MRFNKVAVRRLHYRFAPIAAFPLLITLITGVLYPIAEYTGQGGTFHWLLDWHVGKFGPIDFKIIYPILNGFGLLMLVVTGVMMWFQMRPRKRNTPS
jgi:hypothetical protein